jgi:hypothetical protein
MEFYRWNGVQTKSHIALDLDGPVCGSKSLVSQGSERFKLHHNGLIYSLEYPSTGVEITYEIDCKKCLQWYRMSRYSGKYLDHKI